jgi:hypothetical protein
MGVVSWEICVLQAQLKSFIVILCQTKQGDLKKADTRGYVYKEKQFSLLINDCPQRLFLYMQTQTQSVVPY